MKPNGPRNQRNAAPYSKCGEEAIWRNDLLPVKSSVLSKALTVVMVRTAQFSSVCVVSHNVLTAC